MSEIKYTEEFKEKLLRIFEGRKDFEFIKELVEEGHPFVGRLLQEMKSQGISNETILEAQSLEEVKLIARRNEEVDEIYKEWCGYRDEWIDELTAKRNAELKDLEK